MVKTFTIEEVAKHNSAPDCWIIVEGKVYDVTKFLTSHPGGSKVILKVAGKDATKEFKSLHSDEAMKRYGPELYIGDVAANTATESAPTKPKKERTSFGEMIPYGDANWYQDWKSPYYNDSHRRFRFHLRQFIDKEFAPYVHEWDEKKAVPKELWKKCHEAGWLAAVIGVPWPVDIVGDNSKALALCGLKPSEFDQFHELILIDEVGRVGSGGVSWALFAGLCIGLPPVMHFGTPELKTKVARECLTGEKIICLAITEPYAGSDVANLATSAVKSEDGTHYVVNGEKKWITNGAYADYFTVAVRTGGPGPTGVSLLLIERTMPGVKTRQMLCSGVWPSGTAYVTFEDVKVPVENLIGEENIGFLYIMYNFNHERWGLCVQATRFARVCYEEAFRYAHKRKTFGKRLVDHPVIRMKLANMARQVEASYSWIELITYQLKTMPKEESNKKLGGPLALLKAQSTQTFEYCAREASQIFGGLAYTRGGQGEKVERLYREVRAYAIPGGSEEIMLDLGIRQAMKTYAKAKV